MTQYTIEQTPELELQARELKPGTWIRIAYTDAPPAVALFLGYYGGSRIDGNHRKDFKGDRSLECFYPECADEPYRRYRQNTHATHTQVVEILGALAAPE